MSLENGYNLRCKQRSDINEHLPTLYRYAKECSHITEIGVRSAVSSYAFGFGLKGTPNNKLIQIDLNDHANIREFASKCAAEGVNTVFYQGNDLDVPMEPTELLFIDTWHVYGHLKRELARWHSSVSKYIIMHDTTVDEWEGETIRCRMNASEQSRTSGYPIEEINKGQWPAIEEFLRDHPEWVLKERFTNNNGLTVLSRKE